MYLFEYHVLPVACSSAAAGCSSPVLWLGFSVVLEEAAADSDLRGSGIGFLEMLAAVNSRIKHFRPVVVVSTLINLCELRQKSH